MSKYAYRWQVALVVAVVAIMVISAFQPASQTVQAAGKPTFTLGNSGTKFNADPRSNSAFGKTPALNTLANLPAREQSNFFNAPVKAERFDATAQDQCLAKGGKWDAEYGCAKAPVGMYPFPKTVKPQSAAKLGGTRTIDDNGHQIPVPDKRVFDEPMPSLDEGFDGLNQGGNRTVFHYGVVPPDTNGDVSPTHYIQTTNDLMVIYDRENLDFWTGLPSHLWTGKISELFYSIPDSYCAWFDDGDPVVVYDDQAERWIVTQFGLAYLYFNYPMVECIAVSATSDPMGPWYAYEFSFDTVMPDYPKFGILPGALFMSANEFDGDYGYFLGTALVSFDKNAMYAGDPDAQYAWFDSGQACASLSSTDDYVCGLYSMLPSDLDGGSLTSGTDPFSNMGWFVQFDDDAWSWDGTHYYPYDQLEVWYFYSDWSTYSFYVGIDNVLPVEPFDSNMCNYERSCIGQPGAVMGVDAISDRLMYRLQMRDFGDYFTLVTNHTVDVDGSDHAGVRWYELRFGDSGWSVYQQGTQSPDGADRWMGSAALDEVGNMAIGYSIADETKGLYPNIAYAGRLKSDPLGTLPRTEIIMQRWDGEKYVNYGAGSQLGFGDPDYSRWGDYSDMTVSAPPTGGPACQFWYTNEYYRQTSNMDWYTLIASFSFDSCWEGDTEPPVTTILSGPDDPSHSRSATFEFEATDGTGVGVDYLMCSLDDSDYAECTSPVTYEGLAYGNHVFSVYAVDLVGNTEDPAAGYLWLVDLITRSYKSASGLDGWILEKSEFSNTGGSFLSVDNGTLLVGDNAMDKQYKSILSFNTSNMPDNAVILNATITLFRKGILGANPMLTHGDLMSDIRKGNFPAPGGYASKFQSGASMTDVGSFTGPSGVSLKYSTVLIEPALQFISLLGNTQFRIYFALDDNDNSKVNALQFYSGDTAYTSKRPILYVDYYIP